MWPGTSDSLMRRLMAEINAFRTDTEATQAAYTEAGRDGKDHMAQVAKPCPRGAPEGP
jgi:hypothetical protein